ncbi:hypothetical protein FOQG_12791 [Fusarium oxysporum f. sp. raphani 54005]|uniref:Uncharacterized protein n=3 Tax=Fusarium oxysporum TaxID=5507 RepID=X0BWS7_FUSOX|nr:hypothetical protein FOVG_15858 [Fusarium oxysporum f. sp. pisi HDV247]EXK82959.1 hypothetical protein FOQG_12791 [Fusarium oxysporum f. sp. raphani 54005]EXL68856.1 hypothetical protein FOPG_15114 [Fusarium oxysporum f. sp. conglutinans race 2 54008]
MAAIVATAASCTIRTAERKLKQPLGCIMQAEKGILETKIRDTAKKQ